MASFFFYWTLFLIIVLSNAQINPANPRKNFEPRSVTPVGRIKCLWKPDITLPSQPDWDPNLNTMQELCADVQYGGLSRKNAGGYCRLWDSLEKAYAQSNAQSCKINLDTLDPPLPQRDIVAFDNLNAAGLPLSEFLQSSRFLNYCNQRCYCTSDETTPNIQPEGYNFFAYPDNPIMSCIVNSTNIWRTEISIEDDWQVYLRRSRAMGVSLGVSDTTPTTYIRRLPERNDPLTQPRLTYDYQIWVHEANRVICEGEVPDFDFPAPYAKSNFNNMHDVCAIALSGGNRGANAGAYCHRNNAFLAATEGYQERSVWFSDEMTPRVERTWGGPNFNWAASIRFECRKHCRCASARKNKLGLIDPSIKVWRFIADGEIFQLGPKGNLAVGKTGANGDQGGVSGTGTGSYSGSTLSIAPACGPNKDQFCPSTWPYDLLGAIPQNPPLGEGLDSAQCRLTCQQSEDCAAQSSDECPLQRRCIVDPRSAKQMIIGTLNKFVTTYAVASCIRQHKRLGGRNLESVKLDKRLLHWPCACNATYVSHGCCDAPNGLIYERPAHFLGSLP